MLRHEDHTENQNTYVYAYYTVRIIYTPHVIVLKLNSEWDRADAILFRSRQYNMLIRTSFDFLYDPLPQHIR